MAKAFSAKNFIKTSFGNLATKSEIEDIFEEDMYSTHLKMGVVIMIFEAIMMVASVMRGGLQTIVRRQVYFVLYVMLFLFTAVFMFLLFYAQHKKPKKVRFQINLSFTYALCLCAWGCTITLLDQRSGPNITVYSYVLMATAVFCLIKPWQSVVLFGGSFLFLNIMALALNGNPVFFTAPLNHFNLITNSLFTTALTIIIALALYRYRAIKKHNQIVIKQQYDQITVINQMLNDLAMTDQLTGIGNRRFLDEKMQKMALDNNSNAGNAIGIMIDIDYFKQYNDHYGHQAGDHCLQQLAQVLMDFAKQENAFVIRYGGEEFFICQFGNESALKKAEQLREAILKRCLLRDDVPQGCITVSIGVDVEKDWREIGQDEFLRRCDEALYKAKNSGRNKVCFYSSNIQQAEA